MKPQAQYICLVVFTLLMSGCTSFNETPYQKTQPAIAVPLIAGSGPTQLSAMSAFGTETDRGLLFTLESIFFDLDKATLRPEARQRLDEIANNIMMYNGNRSIVVEGHADSTGPASYNQELSEARAATVRNALIQRGILPARITTQSFGETQPVANNNTASGRQQNRRVEITLLNAMDGTPRPSSTTTTVEFNPSLELR